MDFAAALCFSNDLAQQLAGIVQQPGYLDRDCTLNKTITGMVTHSEVSVLEIRNHILYVDVHLIFNPEAESEKICSVISVYIEQDGEISSNTFRIYN